MTEKLEIITANLTAAGIKLGRNRRREFLELVNDIAQRDNLRPEEVIEEREIKEVLASPEPTSKKRALIMEILRRRRYPRYYRARRAFEQTIKRLKPPGDIKISPPPAFEGSKLKVVFSYSSQAELAEIIAWLQKLEEVDLLAEALAAAEADS